MKRLTILTLAGALAIAACSKPSGQTENGAFHKQVVAYLADHPGVIQEGITAYETKQRAKLRAEAAKLIAPRRGALEHDPLDFVANPDGKITVVEFFDYRCPYCKAALPQLESLIAANKDVRFVFKELPILPDADGKVGVSMRAAIAAIAAGRQGKYLPVHHALMSTRPLDDTGIATALRDNGVNPATVTLSKADEKHIADVRDLALAISATGTPTFVVGDTLVEGNRMDELSAAIAAARKAAKS